jgi:hypothetical protein
MKIMYLFKNINMGLALTNKTIDKYFGFLTRLDNGNFEFKSALEYNLSPQARREIKKIIYEHFDYIVSEWSKYFNSRQ